MRLGNGKPAVFRGFAGFMAALLAFAAAVNLNDPDPVRWVAIYGASCAVSVAVMGTVPLAVPILVGLIALAWGIAWATRVRDLDTYTHMFDEWEMKSEAVEEARETCGLLIVAGWMAIVAFHTWR
jgi:hypothetical protein